MDIRQSINGNCNTMNTNITISINADTNSTLSLHELILFLKQIPQINMTIIVQSIGNITNSTAEGVNLLKGVSIPKVTIEPGNKLLKGRT